MVIARSDLFGRRTSYNRAGCDIPRYNRAGANNSSTTYGNAGKIIARAPTKQ